jgi:hypothetical protein
MAMLSVLNDISFGLFLDTLLLRTSMFFAPR